MKSLFYLSLTLLASAGYGQTPLSAQDALKLAAQNRPALRAAKLGIEQAKATSMSLGAFAPTTLSIGASTRGELGSNDQDLNLTQPLDFFGRRGAGQRLGNAGVQLAIAEYAARATELQNEVLTAYAEAVAAQHQKEVADELLKIAEGLYIATKRRFDEGKVAETQLTRASVEFERAKQSSELQASDLQSTLEKLGGLLGSDSSKLALESDATIVPLQYPLVDSRPDLLILRSQVQTAESEASVAKISNRPELNVQLFRSPWSSDPGTYAGRLQLTWALFDHGKSRHETSAAMKRAEAALKQLEDATLRAKAELKAAQIALEARQKRILRYESILALARDLVTKSQRGYSEGFGTQIDVLEASRALREVEQELVEARQQLSLAVIAQYRASGFLAEVLK